MKKRILIIGSKGMAGHIIYFYLKSLDKYHIADISDKRAFFESTYQLDITDFAALENVFATEQPDIVINCLGVLTKYAEEDPARAILINSYFPQWIAVQSRKYPFRMIQFSTDCEFSGERGSYTEADIPDAKDMYGRTKALGEVNYAPHLNIRTSFVGPELKTDGIGLFNWFMQQQGSVKGYTKAIWTGITTLQLAKSIEKAIDENVSGLYQLVNGVAISKYQLLELFQKVFDKKEIHLVADDSYSVDKSLVASRYELPVLSYSEMLYEMKQWMDVHPELYLHHK